MKKIKKPKTRIICTENNNNNNNLFCRISDIDVGGAQGTTVLHGADGQGNRQGRPGGELGHRAVRDRRRDYCGRQSGDKGRHVPGVQGGQGGR